jgi:hypothetical protein
MLGSTRVRELRCGLLFKSQKDFCEPPEDLARGRLTDLIISESVYQHFEAGKVGVSHKTVTTVFQRLRLFSNIRSQQLRTDPRRFNEGEQATLRKTIKQIKKLKEGDLTVRATLGATDHSGRGRRGAGIWSGVETQPGIGELDVVLTLRLVDGTDAELTGTFSVESRQKIRKNKNKQFADKFTVNGKYRDGYLCLEYETKGRAQRFGFMLLELDPNGDRLDGWILGLGTLVKPPIGCAQVLLKLVENRMRE